MNNQTHTQTNKNEQPHTHNYINKQTQTQPTKATHNHTHEPKKQTIKQAHEQTRTPTRQQINEQSSTQTKTQTNSNISLGNQCFICFHGQASRLKPRAHPRSAHAAVVEYPRRSGGVPTPQLVGPWRSPSISTWMASWPLVWPTASNIANTTTRARL